MNRAAIFSILLAITTVSTISPVQATVENGALTENSIEWCEDVYPQYKAAGLYWFLENYHYSIEARVCGNLYEDPIWEYQGADRVQKLVERSKYYVALEIQESENEAKSGHLDPRPAATSEWKTNSLTKISSDGTMLITAETSNATAGKNMEITITFKNSAQKIIEHVNYDLRVTQNDEEVLVLKGQHSQTGTSDHSTRPLSSGDPVDVEITILGIGMPKDKEEWTGPKGEIVDFRTVPEFGSTVAVVLLVSAIAVVACSRPRPFIRS